MNWEIYHGGAWKTFAALGISDLQRSILTQDADEVTFTARSQSIDDNLLFAYGDTILIRRDGTQWFHGRVVSTPRMGDARTENIIYKVAGPFYWLDHLVFQQEWKYADAMGVTQSGKSSHLFLGQKIISDPNQSGLPVGVPQTTEEQIQEILEWAIDCGAPLQIGDLLTGINVPIREVRELTCGEAIRQMLRWHPDAVTWFDYSTTPPTFHCLQRSALDAVSFPIGSPLNAVSITPRYDLQVPAVVLKFEKVDTAQPDGIARQIQTTQVAPVGATEEVLGVMVATIDLQGNSANYLRAVTTTATIDANSANNTTKKAWWAAKLPWLNDARIVDFAISDVVRSGLEAYPRELVDGQITEWMLAGGVGQEDDEISAKLTIQYANASSKDNHATEPISVRVKTTDAPLGEKEYLSLESFELGEDEPAGLAQSIYDALKDLQYEGQITLKEQEVNGAIIAAGITNSYGVGCVLNLTDSRNEWLSMRALINQVSEDVTNGTTTISFGPAQHLGLGDLIELLRMTRTRFNYTATSARTDTAAGSRGELGLGKHLPKGQASSGAQTYSQFWTLTGNKSVQQDTTGDTAKFEVKETTTSNKVVKIESTTSGALLQITDGTYTAQIDIADLITAVTAIGGTCGVIKLRQAEYCKDNTVYDCLMLISQLRPKGGGTLVNPV